MARNEHQIYCGDIDPPARHGKHCVHLNIHGQEANVVLKFEDISKRLLTNLDDLHLDLLEIAMYVYAADSAISRGAEADVRMGKRWRRSLRFKIPVRDVELWSSDDVCRNLIEILGFMSDDDYTFEFERIRSSPPRETCFEFGTDNNASFHPNEIILFSGGLDSFAGTVETLTSDTNSVALVSHRSSSKLNFSLGFS